MKRHLSQKTILPPFLKFKQVTKASPIFGKGGIDITKDFILGSLRTESSSVTEDATQTRILVTSTAQQPTSNHQHLFLSISCYGSNDNHNMSDQPIPQHSRIYYTSMHIPLYKGSLTLHNTQDILLHIQSPSDLSIGMLIWGTPQILFCRLLVC